MPAKSSLVRSHTLQALPCKPRFPFMYNAAEVKDRLHQNNSSNMPLLQSSFQEDVVESFVGVGVNGPYRSSTGNVERRPAGRQLINDFDPKSAGLSDATLVLLLERSVPVSSAFHRHQCTSYCRMSCLWQRTAGLSYRDHHYCGCAGSSLELCLLRTTSHLCVGPNTKIPHHDIHNVQHVGNEAE